MAEDLNNFKKQRGDPTKYEEITSNRTPDAQSGSADVRRILWEGTFWKQGYFVQSWKERYFVLFSNLEFVYFANKEASKQKGSGSLKNVQRVTAAPENVVCFETPERTWRFVFNEVEQMDTWLGYVEYAITSLHCGWVRKQGVNNRSSWKKRWLVLYSDFNFRYYVDPQCTEIAGEGSFQNIDKILAKADRLEVKTSSRLWSFKFEDMLQQLEWFEYLTYQRQQSHITLARLRSQRSNLSGSEYGEEESVGAVSPEVSSDLSEGKKSPKLDPRELVIQEFIETEYRYMNNLDLVKQCYNDQFIKCEALFPEEFAPLFGEIPTLINLHHNFWRALTDGVSNFDNKTTVIGTILLEYIPHFKMYHSYYTLHKQVQIGLSSIDEHPAFRLYAPSARKTTGTPLSSLMVSPIQRLPRYQLLLEQIVKKTSPSHPDYIHLTNSWKLMKDVNTLLNEQIAGQISRLRTLTVIKEELRDVSMVAPARMFIAKAKARIFQKDKSLGDREIYLFTDMLFSAQHCKIRGLIRKHTIRFQRNGLQAFPSENQNQFELVLSFDCASLVSSIFHPIHKKN